MTGAKKIALIVGATRGLGLGLTRELSSRGWQVIATARKPSQAKALQEAANSSGGRIEVEAIDVDLEDDLESLAQRLAGRRLDLLLLNAGIADPQGRSVVEASREEVTRIIWTNAVSPVRIANRLQSLVVQGGIIAFMSSLAGSIGENSSGGYDLYRMSKTALNMATRSFATTLSKTQQLIVLSLHPGWVRTDMGGKAAPLSVEESVRGLANVIESRHEARHSFLDYTGRELPW